jgi:replicative DNA helicase
MEREQLERRYQIAASSDSLGKLPPQAVELEEAVLGAIMLERDALPQVLEILTPDDFYKDKHHEVFQSCINLFANHQPIDIKTVCHQLRKDGKLEMVGGAFEVTGLTTKVNSAANVAYHARIIKEMSMKRTMIRLASEMQREAYEDTKDVFKLLEKINTELLMLSTGQTASHVNLKNLYASVLEDISQRKALKEEDEFVGVKTGLRRLDNKTGGFQNGDFIVVAARPGMGKTSFVNTLLRNIAVDFHQPVGFLSLEMTTAQTAMREIAMESEIDIDAIIRGKISTEDFEGIVAAASRLSTGNIYVDDTPGLNPYEIRSKAMLLKVKYDIKILFFDYIQLGTDSTTKSEIDAIANISKTLKAVAKELDIPVVGLSQLSRDVEKRGGDKRPRLADLRQSGSIEQDADMVMFLYRPEYYGLDTAEDGTSLIGKGEIIISKYRNGKIGQGWFKFIGGKLKWADLDVEDEDSEQEELPF